MKKELLTVAVCTYNRAGNLPRLIDSLRGQQCPIPYELLFVNNNSTDETKQVLEKYAKDSGVPLRYVIEERQGIAHARNRAIAEAMDSDFLLFMDDDELPSSNDMLAVAVEGLRRENVQCVGGRVRVEFGDNQRPKWLTDELLGFYAELDHGNEPFMIKDDRTPIWTSIVAYRMDVFRSNPDLRFDERYNREGKGVGGGEDMVMFRSLLERKIGVMYLPNMAVDHYVESWRISRKYFYAVHYTSGVRVGMYELDDQNRLFLGAPLFLYRQFLSQCRRFIMSLISGDQGYVRKGMNAFHALGMIIGYRKRTLEQR